MPFVVDQIFPSEQVHLVAGASGVGKSTWLLRMMADWRAGKAILGYQTFPSPHAYVSCDRGKKSIEATLDRLEIPPEDWPTVDGRGLNLNQIVAIARANIPGCRVLFIEGFQSMAPPSEGSRLYAMTSKFLLDCAKAIEREHMTIIGTAHTPKTKENEGYLDLRQRVSGSAAWAAYTETIILIERVKPQDVYDNRRVLHVLPRNAREERYDFMVNDRGCFVETTHETVFFLLYNFLKTLPYEQDIFIETFTEFCSEKSIHRRMLFRWLTDAIEKGELRRTEQGIYRRVRRA